MRERKDCEVVMNQLEKCSDGTNRSRLNMFDFIKGISIFAVLLYHIIGCWSNDAGMETIMVVCDAVFLVLLPVFFLVGGYWFSLVKTGTSNKKKRLLLVKTYVETGVLSILCYMVCHFFRFHSIRGAIKGGLGVIFAFLLGSKRAIQIGQVMIYDIGPIWFLVALGIGELLLECVLKANWIKNKGAAIVVITIAGVVLSNVVWTPLCLSSALVSTLAMYIGYELKKGGYLLKEWKWKEYGVLILLHIACLAVAAVWQLILGYDRTFLELVVGIPGGILLLKLGLKTSGIRKGIVRIFERMGRYSLWILMVHTIEMLSIDWISIKNSWMFSDHQAVGFGVMLVIRWLLVTVGCMGINTVERARIRRRLKPRLED